MTITKKIIATLTFLAITFPVFSMPNPAAMNCAKPGMKYVMVKNVGICIFPDGTYCEEWAFFKGQCQPGMNTFPGGKYKRNKIKKYCLLKSAAGTQIVMCKLMR